MKNREINKRARKRGSYNLGAGVGEGDGREGGVIK